MFATYVARGTHPERYNFESLVGAGIGPPLLTGFQSTRPMGPVGLTTIWQLIDDAVEGTGGFSDGTYLAPHVREWDKATSRFDDKFYARMSTAAYDNFVKPIAETPWNYIIQMRELIERKCAEGLDASLERRLQSFWADADGRGSEMTDFMEYPASQARRFGTGWILVDRPSQPLPNRSVDERTAVYAYCVPTEYVMYWEFDVDFRLVGLVIKEPWAEQSGLGETVPFDLRVWTPTSWAVFRGPDAAHSTQPTSDWQMTDDNGRNELGEVPAVQLFDEDPGPGRGFGRAVVPTVAKTALITYNQDSEIREIQRNTGFPFLAVPVKDVTRAAAPLVVGDANVLKYDGSSGEPRWVTQALTEATAIAEDRDKRKEACYSAAHMRAMAGWIQTSSGFHAEAEFDETNRAIGKFAASCERAERKVARLVLRYSNLGMTEEDLREAFSVSYPRNFGLHNIDEVQKRVKERLELSLGQDDAEKAIFDLYSAQYPREPKDTLEAAAKKAAAEYVKSKQPPPMLGAPAQVSERLKAALAAKGSKPTTTKQLPPGKQEANK